MSFFLVFHANFAEYVLGFLKMAARVALMSACDHCLLKSYLILIPVIARRVISVCKCKRLDLCWPQ
jgi:hypothetical protein